MLSGISLANKCQLLFGAAIVLILIGALAVPWTRTQALVRQSQLEMARQLADAWIADRIQLGTPEQPGGLPEPLETVMQANADGLMLRMALVRVEDIEALEDRSDFLAQSLRRFLDSPLLDEHMIEARVDGVRVYRYARPLREAQMRAIRDHSAAAFAGGAFAPDVTNPLRAILLVDRASQFAQDQLLTSRVFMVAAGIIGTILAALAFHFILTRLFLSPVRSLRATADRVQAGDLRVRAQVRTGDEFEQLSDAFNAMLDRLEQGQRQLTSLNQTLDLKVSELAEANVGLFESNRLKSEFLANVSHELRTPLNSIIGFAELLEELARADPAADPKRVRYIGNILTSSRSLLEMINDLLNMAKIESGRMEVNIESTSVGDLVEGLANIMRPQAERKEIALRTVIGQRLPVIETDQGKLQQILYNFLSNAIKFTPTGGTVTISADRVGGAAPNDLSGVRVAVADTGPGIAHDMQEVIFEKFRQIDASHTRQHQGTGLGLAICRELAHLLHASVSFVSEPGRGTTFFVDLPLTHQPEAPQALMAGT
jgi:signal transduction histidine kinase